MSEHLWDVVAVNIKTLEQRVMERGLSERNADAYIHMAVIRRGVDVEFFKRVPSASSSATQE